MSQKFDPKVWAGTHWKCGITGKELIVPDDVKPKQMFIFGQSFIDVGDGYYSRMGGQPMYVEESKKK